MKVSKKLKEIIDRASFRDSLTVEESTLFEEFMDSLEVDNREEVDLHFEVIISTPFLFLERQIEMIIPFDEIYEEMCKSEESNKIVRKIILEFSKGNKIYGIPVEWRTKE